MSDTATVVLDTLGALQDERRRGVLQQWEHLADMDPGATFFQGPLWAMNWYEAYADEWEPMVVVVVSRGALAGLAALARQRRSGRVTFAGDHMADYRDFLAHPHEREAVVGALVRTALERSDGYFAVGPTSAVSTTVPVVCGLSGRTGRWWVIARADPCWRADLTPATIKSLETKKSIKQTRAFYRRAGALRYRRITAPEDWAASRETFFRQNTLRQLMVERPPSFHDSRKRKFFDAMFAGDPGSVHVSGLWLDDRCLASHFGYCAKGTVYLGAMGMDIGEVGRHSHSPGMLWLADLIANAAEEGYRQLDLTLGDEQYKARVGTVCVEVPRIEIYASRSRYWRANARQNVHAAMRGVARRLLTDGVYAALKRRASSNVDASTGTAGREPQVTFTVSAEAFVVPAPLAAETAAVSHRQDVIDDLARVDDPSFVRSAVRAAIARTPAKKVLHTFLVDDRLVGFAWCLRYDDDVRLEGLRATSDRDAPSLGHLVAHVTGASFATRASRVTVYANAGDRALHEQLLSMGFAPAADRSITGPAGAASKCWS